VYEPGKQAWNFVHVEDVTRMYVRSAGRVLDQLASGETGTETQEVVSEQNLSIKPVAESVREVASEERRVDLDIELVENLRSTETMVEELGADISAARENLRWELRNHAEMSVRGLLEYQVMIIRES